MAAVYDGRRHPAIRITDLNVDERMAVVAHPVLEGVFHKDDQQQRRDGDAPGQTPGSVEPDIEMCIRDRSIIKNCK